MLRADQNHFDSLHNLGIIRLLQGYPKAAVRQILRALAINPHSAEAHANLGTALLRLGRATDAITELKKALAIRPDYVEVYYNLGILYQNLNRHELAIEQYAKAISIKPDYTQACYNIGVSLQAVDRHKEAIQHYKRVIGISPASAEVHNNLGNALMHLDNPEEALIHYKMALESRPHLAGACNNVGSALHMLDRQYDAIAMYERAIALDPDYADAHNNLGVALEAVGRLREAWLAFEKAIELAPRRADFYRHLFTSKKATIGDPRLAAMQELASDIRSLRTEEQIELHFALGKAFADLEEHERSFRHLVEGNALKRKQIQYEEVATLSEFTRLRAQFTSEFIRSRQGHGDPSPVPIFIIGMPRSGSTLIEQILASHPLVFGGGELRDFTKAMAPMHGDGDLAIPVREFKLAFSGEQLRMLAARYLARIEARAPRADRITDKMPSNFRFAGPIHLALPNARIIHAVRDPVDTCLSCFSVLFTGTSQPYSYELGELGRYYHAYRQLMDHWRTILPETVMLDVNYEDIVVDFEGQVRRILGHCGLPWDNACLAFHKTQRSVRTASASQVRRPVYRSSVGRWRRYEQLLHPLLDSLGELGKNDLNL